MKNTTIILAFVAVMCVVMLGTLYAVERAHHHSTQALTSKPVDLDLLDFWSPTSEECANEDPVGFDVLTSGEPSDDEVSAWFWQTRQTIYQRKYGHPYVPAELPQETR